MILTLPLVYGVQRGNPLIQAIWLVNRQSAKLTVGAKGQAKSQMGHLLMFDAFLALRLKENKYFHRFLSLIS